MPEQATLRLLSRQRLADERTEDGGKQHPQTMADGGHDKRHHQHPDQSRTEIHANGLESGPRSPASARTPKITLQHSKWHFEKQTAIE
jgi:hypothetical protein